jgi:hypothetical protein
MIKKKLFLKVVDIIIVNHIVSFKIDVDSTFFVLRPISYLKISIKIVQLQEEILATSRVQIICILQIYIL